jgi:phosphoribosylaminoimidazole (AIR) synthetase
VFGIGMIVIVSPDDVEHALEHLGDDTMVIGAMVERGRGAPVRYQGKLDRSAA